MRKRTRVLLVLSVALAGLALAVWADSLSISGKQIRGVPGRDAQLICSGFSLPRTGTIAAVDCGGDGFWIEGSGLQKNFAPGGGVGFSIPAGGPYYVYPNLKNGQSEASVTVTVNY